MTMHKHVSCFSMATKYCTMLVCASLNILPAFYLKHHTPPSTHSLKYMYVASERCTAFFLSLSDYILSYPLHSPSAPKMYIAFFALSISLKFWIWLYIKFPLNLEASLASHWQPSCLNPHTIELAYKELLGTFVISLLSEFRYIHLANWIPYNKLNSERKYLQLIYWRVLYSSV